MSTDVDADLSRILASQLDAWLHAADSPVPVILDSLRRQGHLAPELQPPASRSLTGNPIWAMAETVPAVVVRNPSGRVGVRLNRGDYVEFSRAEASRLVTLLWSALHHDPEEGAPTSEN